MTTSFPPRPIGHGVLARIRGSIWLQLLALGGGLLTLLIGLQLGVAHLVGALKLRSPAAWILTLELAVAAAMMFAYRGGVRALEQRDALELGVNRSVAFVGLGILIGAALFLSVNAVLWTAGAIARCEYLGPTGLVVALGTSAAAAVGEEVIFRGALFRLIEERSGTLVAIAVSASVFGLLHAANRGATWISTAAITLEAGVLLGLTYAAMRSLWLPIGLHLGWNFTEGGIVGAVVSGGHAHGLYQTTYQGPMWLTGGAFGPEASLVAVAICLVAAGIFAVVVVRRGEWRAAR